ncbi:hypothetical protein Srubr_18120 [Streptomyces rubradiris]|uniref:Uncharacterized protein n=1 Tax=Streptomyces rubradiris TaxID=285531 RepID=A0ABQ3R7Z3_STRRR|nr:hypothetical protein Srubr_18120 [Streptomyces rubradiris]
MRLAAQYPASRRSPGTISPVPVETIGIAVGRGRSGASCRRSSAATGSIRGQWEANPTDSRTLQ